MDSMMRFDGNAVAIKAAADAICQIIKAAAGDSVIVQASMTALAEVAKAPQTIHVSNCTLTNSVPERKRK
jgi:hypothetical protein